MAVVSSANFVMNTDFFVTFCSRSDDFRVFRVFLDGFVHSGSRFVMRDGFRSALHDFEFRVLTRVTKTYDGITVSCRARPVELTCDSSVRIL
jgi:hypothetical protein